MNIPILEFDKKNRNGTIFLSDIFKEKENSKMSKKEKASKLNLERIKTCAMNILDLTKETMRFQKFAKQLRRIRFENRPTVTNNAEEKDKVDDFIYTGSSGYVKISVYDSNNCKIAQSPRIYIDSNTDNFDYRKHWFKKLKNLIYELIQHNNSDINVSVYKINYEKKRLSQKELVSAYSDMIDDVINKMKKMPDNMIPTVFGPVEQFENKNKDTETKTVTITNSTGSLGIVDNGIDLIDKKSAKPIINDIGTTEIVDG